MNEFIWNECQTCVGSEVLSPLSLVHRLVHCLFHCCLCLCLCSSPEKIHLETIHGKSLATLTMILLLSPS